MSNDVLKDIQDILDRHRPPEQYNCGRCDELIDVDDLVHVDGEDGSGAWCKACAIESLQARLDEAEKELEETKR